MQNNNNPDRTNLLKGYNMLLYFAGSMIMYEPTEECITDFITDGILKKLPVISDNPGFMRAAALLREPCPDKEACRKILVADYRRLFSVDGPRLAIPRKSEYAPANIMPSENTGDFYDSYGWKSVPRGRVPDDHLGIELLFLTKLIDKFLQLDDEPCCCEMKKEIHRFIGEHIIGWIPEWNKRMQENSQSQYYKGISGMVLACIEDLHGIFGSQNRLL